MLDFCQFLPEAEETMQHEQLAWQGLRRQVEEEEEEERGKNAIHTLHNGKREIAVEKNFIMIIVRKRKGRRGRNERTRSNKTT
jgi:hypothetical protein